MSFENRVKFWAKIECAGTMIGFAFLLYNGANMPKDIPFSYMAIWITTGILCLLRVSSLVGIFTTRGTFYDDVPTSTESDSN